MLSALHIGVKNDARKQNRQEIALHLGFNCNFRVQRGDSCSTFLPLHFILSIVGYDIYKPHKKRPFIENYCRHFGVHFSSLEFWGDL